MKLAGVVLPLLIAAVSVSVGAQPGDDITAQAAHEYDLGTAAYKAGHYSEAAAYYERANELDPSRIAALSAARAYLQAADQTLVVLSRGETNDMICLSREDLAALAKTLSVSLTTVYVAIGDRPKPKVKIRDFALEENPF